MLGPNFRQIENKWQKEWEKAGIFKTKIDPKKKKYYILEMFVYPSAAFLHMGHVRNFTIGDITARYKRMQGFNVLYPTGFDSFGLPAENAAKKEGIHPKEYTEKAIQKITEYFKDLGNSYDWSRKISTHEPEYYKWNQYFFLKFLEKGLVYRKKAPVNWCPDCKSTLANEEVVNGKCWRHEETEVIQKELEQWFLKTTAYADEILRDIDKLEWSDRIKTLQRNWIGKSEGILVDFPIKGSKEKLQIFTTRPDTIYGVTFMVVSPKHKLINELAKENKKQLENLNKIQNEEQKEKEGVFLGSYVIHPLTKQEIPIYAANFVVAEYGTGAVMAVPAHDKRDYEFAKKYNLPIKEVILGGNIKKETYTGKGPLENSDQFDYMDNECAIVEISNYIRNEKLGKKIIQYKLRDWLISRQRYWGTPIPIIYCDKCGIVPLKEKDLPLKLPEKVDYKLEGNPLNHVKAWVNVPCPKCKSNAKRETDTMGGFVDSSWYFLRFCSPNNDKEAFDKKEVDYWMPVDQYIGGIEHAVGHLIYSRFFTKVLRDLNMLKFDEPFQRLFNQGIVYKDNHKMSKSFGNVVYQTDISSKYGIDTARLFLMSVSNPESDMEWSDKGVEGSFRFLQKIQNISELNFKKIDEKGQHKRNLAIKNFTENIEHFKFNIAVIELMKYTDFLTENPSKEGYEDLLKMISPFAPHTAEEIWHKLGNKSFISVEKWPEHDEKKVNPKFEEEEKQIEKLVNDINNIVNLFKEKRKEVSKAFIYVLPKELENYSNSLNEIQKRTNLQIKAFSVADKNKHDPENKSSKAKPGKPAIYLE
ncbi:MAG: leucine--tRNA ligase [Nanoarchaeota archaeon]